MNNISENSKTHSLFIYKYAFFHSYIYIHRPLSFWLHLLPKLNKSRLTGYVQRFLNDDVHKLGTQLWVGNCEL